MTEKILSPKEIQTTIENLGYDVYPHDRDVRVLIVITPNKANRAAILKNEIAPALEGFRYDPGRGSKENQSREGRVVRTKPDPIWVKALPQSKASRISTIDARTFCKGAQVEKIRLNEQMVRCYVFSKPHEVEKAIIAGCLGHPGLGERVADAFQGFFDQGVFSWNGLPLNVINKLGVVAGEILVGYIALKHTHIRHFHGTNPIKGMVKTFIIPDDPKFTTVDSILELFSGEQVPISNKYEAGAPGSLFSYVTPKAMEKPGMVTPSSLKTFTGHLKKKGIQGTDTARSVWEWGCNVLLGAKCKNPIKVKEVIQGGRVDEEAIRVMNLVQSRMQKERDHKHLRDFPRSISHYFSSKLSEKLNRDSRDEIAKLLSSKNFYQARLDKGAWVNGQVHFNIVKAGTTQVRLTPRKCSYNDISCRNGWVNYEIKMK